MAVRIEAAYLEEIMPKKLSIAAINSNKLCVVAGPIDENWRKFSVPLGLKEYIPVCLLQTSHAFHSRGNDG